MLVLMTGCTTLGPKEGSGNYPLEVTDSFEREVTIPKLPERIVSLAPSNTEILFALGLGEKVVGITDFCNYPEETADIDKIGSYGSPDAEKVIAAKPDLVVADSQDKDLTEQLTTAGIPVIAIRADNISGLYENIEVIGKATAAEKAATELVDAMRQRIEAVEKKVKDVAEADRPLVFYEVWHDPPMAAGPDTFIDNIITAAGGRNVMADAETQWPQVDLEVLISKDPQVLLLGHSGQDAAAAKARSNWQTISAIKNDAIYELDEDLFNRPGPRVADAVEELAKLLYPDLFK